jgi:hypothetical protein
MRPLFRTIFAAIAVTLALSSPSFSQTVNELTREFERLVRLESDILDQQARIQTHVESRDLVLIETTSGNVVAISRPELTRQISKIYDWARVLGLDDAYIARLPIEMQTVAKLAQLFDPSGKQVIQEVVGKIAANTDGLRRSEAEKLAVLEQHLEDVRRMAQETMARRDRLVRDVNNGPPKPENNPVCLDDNIPETARAIFWASGYGGSTPYVVKGDYICGRSANGGFLLIAGGMTIPYYCDATDNKKCTAQMDKALSFERKTDASGRPLLVLETGGDITLHPPKK